MTGLAGPAFPQTATDQPAASTLPQVTVTSPQNQNKQAQRTRRDSDLNGTRRARQPAPAAGASNVAAAAFEPVTPGRGEISSAVTSLPAATTVFDATAISRQPVATYGDLFRSLPGFNVSNYGQGGIGYGLSLRGYTDGEHGRDIAYVIDGVPLNEVSSIHTPNYADLNILLPETVKSIEIIRGPFSVEYGDSNLGGSVNITTKDFEPFASIGASGGTQATARGIATYSTTQGVYVPYFALEGYRTDGYRDNSFVDRYNSFNKVSTKLDDGSTVSFRAQAYGTQFGAPGYSSRDAIRSGAVSERAATNLTDGGSKQLENFVTNYSSGAQDQELKGTLFVSHDYFNRYADFGGGQRYQHDDRTMTGGRLSKVWTGAVADSTPVQLLVGGNWRSDFIDSFQAPTTARAVTGPTRIDLGVNQTNVAGFAQLQIKPVSWLKLTGGARFDQFYYDLNNRVDPLVSPSISPSVVSPKGGIAITPVSWLEFFGNYGEGFRSIDATIELIDSSVRPNVVNNLQPFKVVSKEGGAQIKFDKFRFLADVWTTDSANESFQAAPGLPVSFLGRARREGFDLDGRYFLANDSQNMVALFANYGGVRTRLFDAGPAIYVPNVPDHVANVGIDFNVNTRNAQRLSGTFYTTFVGKKNISQDGVFTTSPFARVTGKLAYSWPDGWTTFTQATYYPGDRLSEIAFNFNDNVTGITSADIFTSAQPMLVVLGGLTYRFPTAFAAASTLVTE